MDLFNDAANRQRLAISAEGNIYFSSDKLYALAPDGTQYAAPVPIVGIVSPPTIDDKSNYVYVAVANHDGSFDVLRYTKQLTNGETVSHVPLTSMEGGSAPSFSDRTAPFIFFPEILRNRLLGGRCGTGVIASAHLKRVQAACRTVLLLVQTGVYT